MGIVMASFVAGSLCEPCHKKLKDTPDISEKTYTSQNARSVASGFKGTYAISGSVSTTYNAAIF